MTISVGNGGAYKGVPSVDVGVGGAWKRATRGWVGVGGAWKDFLGQFTQMTAGVDGGFIGYSAGSPYSINSWGSLSPPLSVNGKNLIWINTDATRIQVGFASASDPGQTGVFTTFSTGLPAGNLAAADATYTWVGVSGAGYWTWTAPAEKYADGNTYSVGFMQ